MRKTSPRGTEEGGGNGIQLEFGEEESGKKASKTGMEGSTGERGKIGHLLLFPGIERRKVNKHVAETFLKSFFIENKT